MQSDAVDSAAVEVSHHDSPFINQISTTLQTQTSTNLVATKILSGFRSGSSLPVLVETTAGTKCVVKWNGSGEGPVASAVDWICLLLARAIGIPVPTPQCVKINPTLALDATSDEIQDLVGRSVGMNLGMEYIEQSSAFEKSLTVLVDPALRKLIYLFDVLFCNIDRTDHNPNMVFAKGKLFCIDFSAAMSVKMFIHGGRYSESTLFPLIRRHPFYQRQSSDDKLPIPSNRIVKEIIFSTPDEWFPDADSAKEKLSTAIIQLLKDSGSVLEHRLSLLDTLVPETAEEGHERTLQNRRAFEAKWGKL